ncbi:MAG: flagellar hook-length control protein FliK [Clostridiales bacterium]|jgi:hypothetical protein|nr:flagellar hook-length control protein FliK [Clostridiales bacterium]
MKIVTEINQPTNNLTSNKADYKTGSLGSAVKTGAVSAGDLAPGDRFRAGIVNVTPDSITLRLDNGATFQARTLNSPDAHIGDSAIFQVTEIFKGKILLEMVRPDAAEGQALVTNGVIRKALIAADMPVTDQNIKLAMSLVRSGMPIDAETLQKAAFFMYSNPKLNMGQIKFLINEGFPAEPKTLETLEGLMNKTLSLGKNLEELIETINNLPDANVKEEYLRLLSFDDGLTETLRIISGESPVLDELADEITDYVPEEIVFTSGEQPDVQRTVKATAEDEIPDGQTEEAPPAQEKENGILADIKDKVKEKFLTNLEETGLKDLPGTYKELERATALLQAAVRQRGGDPRIEKSIQDIRDGLEFMNHIRHGKEFLQIPFQTVYTENEAELHVFRNPMRKNPELGQSALIAMDYNELGHVEVFVTRRDKTVSLAFKAETLKILGVLGGGIYRLNDALAQAGFKVGGLSFNRLREASDVTFMPGEQHGSITKYSVDLRC